MPESRRLPRSRQTTRTDRKGVPRAEAYPNAIIRKLHRGASGVTMVTPALPDHRSDMSTDLSRCCRLNLRVSLVVSPAMNPLDARAIWSYRQYSLAVGGRMFAVIRHYQFDKKDSAEIDRLIQDQFVPIISKAQGFVRYYWLDTGAGEGASFGVFKDKAGADESVRLA